MGKCKEILKKHGIIAALKYQYFKSLARFFYKHNRPLPPKYKFIVVTYHGAWHNAFIQFLQNLKIHCNNRYWQNGFERYCDDYGTIGSFVGDSVIVLSEHNFKDCAKYLQLMNAKVPALVLVRDPISALKSYLNVAQDNKKWGGGGKIINRF